MIICICPGELMLFPCGRTLSRDWCHFVCVFSGRVDHLLGEMGETRRVWDKGLTLTIGWLGPIGLPLGYVFSQMCWYTTVPIGWFLVLASASQRSRPRPRILTLAPTHTKSLLRSCAIDSRVFWIVLISHLYDVGHVSGWELYNMRNLGLVSWVGDVLCILAHRSGTVASHNGRLCRI